MEGKKENKSFYIILSFFTIVLSMLGAYLVVTLCQTKPEVQTIKDYSNIQISDTGIAGSVLKVYDSVVVVETYKNNKLYATGTGFVFKTDDNYGYILTNHHVVESGTSFKVRFTNGEEVEVTVAGSDEYSDVAVLKVSKDKVISVATIGSSSDMLVGDTTFVIGAPLDADTYSWTVTRGILSGKDRLVEVSSSTYKSVVMNVLQTDTAINNGNSGGPICNANGEVIGITSLKLVDESVEGMGFAIPIETAISYAEKLINGEEIVQPYLGVGMINVTDAYYKQAYYKMLSEYNITSGVVIDSVEKGSPASQAGINKGDIIVKINDNEVTSIGYLRYYLYNYAPGDKVTITYIRNGETKETVVTLTTKTKLY